LEPPRDALSWERIDSSMATSSVNSISSAEPGVAAIRKPVVRRADLLVLLLASAALMVSWSFAVPIFECPDEPAHWQYAQYLRQTHSLPPYNHEFEEGNSPPLYYLLIAPLATETQAPPSAFQYNADYTKISLPFPPRYYQNAPGDLGRYWPIRAARLVSILVSLFTVWFCYLAGKEATGSAEIGLLVGGLVAFLPQFTFRGMNVSSDSLLTMFSAAATFLMIRLVTRGFAWRTGVLAALAIAGAFLSKTNAVFLPGTLALAVLTDKAEWRTRILRTAALGALILLIVAPWLIRNQYLYGDPLARKAMFTAVSDAIRVKPLFSRYFVKDFPVMLAASFVGDFGWLDIALPKWAYGMYGILFGLGGLLAARGFWRRQLDRRLLVVLLSAAVLNLMIVININLMFDSAQGRYMFPALPAIAVLLGLGAHSLGGWSRRRTWLTIGGLAAANVVILTALIIPDYWPAPPRKVSRADTGSSCAIHCPKPILQSVEAGSSSRRLEGRMPNAVQIASE
jgi:4-amino-4-deoxy-L-arabinose transferase-like glycosyltransferase